MEHGPCTPGDADVSCLENLEGHDRGVDQVPQFVRKESEALASAVSPSMVDIANATRFGPSAGIVTTSLRHASHFKRNSESGLVMVNLPTTGLDYHVPFGGRKKSSYGPREQGAYAKEFYTVVKTAYAAS